MAVFKPKTRMISFRLSEDEYHLAHQSSLADGARSVSDYARAVLCRAIASDPGLSVMPPAVRLDEIDQRMRELDRELRRLSLLVEDRQQRPNGRDGFNREC